MQSIMVSLKQRVRMEAYGQITGEEDDDEEDDDQSEADQKARDQRA